MLPFFERHVDGARYLAKENEHHSGPLHIKNFILL